MKISYIAFGLALMPTIASAASEKPITQKNVKAYIGLDVNWFNGNLNNKLGEDFSAGTGYLYNVDSDELINPKYIGFTVNAGAKINDYFGIETFYQNTGNSKSTIDFYDTLGTTKISQYKSKTSFWAFGLDALGYLPITDSKFSFIGSLGLGYYNTKGTFDIINYVYNISETEKGTEKNIGLRIGFGGQYDFAEHWAARAMIKYAALNSDNDDAVDGVLDISFGVKYIF